MNVISIQSANYTTGFPVRSHTNKSVAVCYSEGLFITSSHITLNAYKIWGFTPSLHQKMLKFTVVSQCPLRGIGIIKVDDPSEFQPVKLSALRRSDDVDQYGVGRGNGVDQVFTEDNKLLGVSFRGKFISSRSVAVTIRDLSRCDTMVDFPEFNLNWNLTTKEFMQKKCGSYVLAGIHVTCVGSNSCFKALCNDDIITHIRFEDSISPNSEDDVIDLSFPNPSIDVIGYINRYGKVLIVNSNDSGDGDNQMLGPTPSPDSIPRYDHRLTLRDIENELSVGSKLRLQICRDKAWYLLESDFFCRSNRIHSVPDRYDLFAGMIITSSDRLQFPEDMTPKLRVTNILEGSVIHILNSSGVDPLITEGDVISTVNDKPVRTLTELHEAIPSEDGLISIRMENGSEFVSLINSLREDDTQLKDKLNIPSNRAFLSSVVIE